MATYYVRKTGNDTTGDGSTGNPWLTISKAQASASGGDIIKIGSGTYAEDTGGVGYWNVNKTYASYVTFESESGVASDVIITGASSAQFNVLCALNAAYYKFRYLTFTQRVSTARYVFRSTTSINHITLEYCSFVHVTDASSACYAFRLDPANTRTTNDVNLTNCTFTSVDGTNTPIYLSADAGGTVSNVTITDCTIAGGTNGCVFDGVASVAVNGGTVSSKSSSGIRIGADAETGGKASTVTITGTTVNMTGATGGHSILVGNGAANCVINGVSVPVSYDHAIVLKEHGTGGGTEVKNCSLVGGTGAAVLLKAATNASIHDNTLRASSALLGVIYVTAGNTGNTNSANSINYNRCKAGGSGIMFFWNAASDGGSNVCDYNAYRLASGGWGTLPTGDVSGTTITELRAAWDAYGAGTNDDNSRMAGQSVIYLGRGGMGGLGGRSGLRVIG